MGNGLKMRFKNMHTGAAPLGFVDEKEAINYILQAICRDEITTSITYHQSKEKLTVARFFLLYAACVPRRSRAEPFSQRNR